VRCTKSVMVLLLSLYPRHYKIVLSILKITAPFQSNDQSGLVSGWCSAMECDATSQNSGGFESPLAHHYFNKNTHFSNPPLNVFLYKTLF
jgi:hypothetical protein